MLETAELREGVRLRCQVLLKMPDQKLSLEIFMKYACIIVEKDRKCLSGGESHCLIFGLKIKDVISRFKL